VASLAAGELEGLVAEGVFEFGCGLCGEPTLWGGWGVLGPMF